MFVKSSGVSCTVSVSKLCPTSTPPVGPVLSNKSPAAKAGIPLSMRQAAADRNAKFQAAKKSGNLKQFRADNPKMSGTDRAKAMARARIASKRAE